MADEPEYADSARYAELTGFHGEWRDLFWNADFLELMARRWRLHEVGEALDVGCGAGHFSRTMLGLLPKEATMVGLDHEADFFELAKKGAKARGQGDRYRLVQGSVEALPFHDNSFDLVTCQLVLIHVADLAAALEEMIRVTRPGGLIALVEPDNRAGNLALFGGTPLLSDEETAELVRFQLVTERGKRALGEGDNSVGSRLPGVLRQLGLDDVSVYTNDRCMDLAPPYEEPKMKIALDQELAWLAEDISIMFGTEGDSRRLYLAGGGDAASFDRAWALSRTWMRAMERGIKEHTFHAARGFVMYLAAGRKPQA